MLNTSGVSSFGLPPASVTNVMATTKAAHMQTRLYLGPQTKSTAVHAWVFGDNVVQGLGGLP